MSVICPSVTSSDLQGPRIEPAVRARTVLAERRLPVRRRRQEAGPAALRTRTDPEVEDIGAAAEPHLVGGHRLRRILVDERGERLHVVALEGVEVAGEQRLLLVVDLLGHVGRRQVAGLERRPRPLQRAVDGRHGGAQQLGDLVGPPAQDLAEDQHGPLAGRQVLQGADERQLDALPGDGHLAGVAVVGEDPTGGDRLDPRGLGQDRPGRRRPARRLGAEVHRAGPALAAV